MDKNPQKVTLVGDAHGRFDDLWKVTENIPNRVIQLGDMGVGFRSDPTRECWTPNVSFIHGNHDNPDVCAQKPGFLGRFGSLGDAFFVSGAKSIDRAMRVPGLDWWDTEELSIAELSEAVYAYKEAKPRVMLTHTCPFSIVQRILGRSLVNLSNTEMALQQMLDEHSPEEWYFGHFHRNWVHSFGGCNFRCVAELSTVDIEISGWEE